MVRAAPLVAAVAMAGLGSAGAELRTPDHRAAVRVGRSVLEAAETARRPARTVLLGRSVRGRPITAVRLGDPDSPRKALVVGVIHGDEPAGLRVIRALRRMRGLRGVDLWTVATANSDGVAAGRRRNARGVDLNRNFPWRWRPSRRASPYYGGPRPLSEPESRALARLVLRLRPRVSIWYHQPYGFVVLPPGRAVRAARRYARLARWPGRRLARLPGTVADWQNHALPGTSAFVVEFGPDPPSPATAARHARAAARLVDGH